MPNIKAQKITKALRDQSVAFEEFFKDEKTLKFSDIDSEKLKSNAHSYCVHPTQIKIITGLNARVEMGDLDELARSLIEHFDATGQALIAPLVLRGVKGDKTKFQLFAGHRRLQAASLAYTKYGKDLGPLLSTIYPAATPTGFMMSINAMENSHKQLSPIEEACMFQKYKKAGLTSKNIAKMTGRSECHVSKRLSILSGSDTLIEAVEEGTLQAQTAAEIVTRNKGDTEAQDTLVKIATGSVEGRRAVVQQLKTEMNQKGVQKSTKKSKREKDIKGMSEKEQKELVTTLQFWIDDLKNNFDINPGTATQAEVKEKIAGLDPDLAIAATVQYGKVIGLSTGLKYPIK